MATLTENKNIYAKIQGRWVSEEHDFHLMLGVVKNSGPWLIDGEGDDILTGVLWIYNDDAHLNGIPQLSMMAHYSGVEALAERPPQPWPSPLRGPSPSPLVIPNGTIRINAHQVRVDLGTNATEVILTLPLRNYNFRSTTNYWSCKAEHPRN